MGAARSYEFAPDEVIEDLRAKQLKVERATVFVGRPTVRAVLMRELKSYGIPELKLVETVEECIEDLQNFPKSLLVVDWECGEQKVVKVLHAAQGAHKVDTRPIYFIALEVSERVISVASEYNVAQIHTGEITQDQIVKNLDELLVFSLRSPVCEEIFREVSAFRKHGDWDASTESLQVLCRAEPDNLRAAVEYGYSLCESGKVEAAEKCLKELAKKYPSDLRTKHLLARCAMKKGRFKVAQRLLQEASLISPHNVERLTDFGRVLLNLDQVDQALGKFNDALRQDKDCQDAQIGKAQCQLLQGHVNEAMKLFAQLQSAQELASVFNGAAILAIRHQHYKQGISLYKTACGYLRKDKQVLARVIFNMGVGLLKWGKIEIAQLAFEQASSLDPGLLKARHNLNVVIQKIQKGDLRPLESRHDEIEEIDDPIADLPKGETPVQEKGEGEVSQEVDDSYFQSLIAQT